MTAYDYLLRGNKHFHRLTHEDILEARRLYQKATELDPQFAQAISRLAATDNLSTSLGWEADESRPDTMETVQRALALDSNDNRSRLTLGWTLLRKQRYDESEGELQKGLALNPGDADCVAWAALASVVLGRADEAFELINKAMRLNPLHQNYYHMISGHAAYFSGRYDDAVRGFKQGSEFGIWHHANLAAAYGQMGASKKHGSKPQCLSRSGGVISNRTASLFP